MFLSENKQCHDHNTLWNCISEIVCSAAHHWVFTLGRSRGVSSSCRQLSIMGRGSMQAHYGEMWDYLSQWYWLSLWVHQTEPLPETVMWLNLCFSESTLSSILLPEMILLQTFVKKFPASAWFFSLLSHTCSDLVIFSKNDIKQKWSAGGKWPARIQ